MSIYYYFHIAINNIIINRNLYDFLMYLTLTHVFNNIETK